MSFVDSIKIDLRAHPKIVSLVEQLEAAVLENLAAEAETLVAGAIPIVGGMLKPLITKEANSLVASIEAKSTTAIGTWLDSQSPINFVKQGSGQAGIISFEEVPSK